MIVSYDSFKEMFLDKVHEYEFLQIDKNIGDDIIDGYMMRSLTRFSKICKNKISNFDKCARTMEIDSDDEYTIYEIVDIVSDGMIAQWMKPYVYRQENLENVINTRDFTMYSPAELLMRVSGTYREAERDYTNRIKEYSYSHGTLSDLHL